MNRAGHATALVVADSITLHRKGPFGLLPAFGVARAFNTITSTVRAAIEHSAVTATAGSVDLLAKSSPVIVSVGVGIVQATQFGDFAVSTAKNHVENTVDAHISDGSMVGAGTSISVAARDGGTIVAVAGHLALATAKPTSGAVAVGISISTNTMHNTISAYVNHATADAPAVAVTTTEDADITAVSIGGEHPDGFAVGASGSNNELTNNLEARVSGGAVVTATTASITAADDGTIVAISGNFGLAERFEAVGGAGSRNEIADRVTAVITGTDTHVDATTVDLAASTDADITAISVGATEAFDLAFGGSVTLNSIGNTIDACVCASALVTGTTVRVTARDTSSSTADAGGAGVIYDGGGAKNGLALGASFATNEINSTIRARVSSATVNPTGDLEVAAISEPTIHTLVIAGGGSGSSGTGGRFVTFIGAGALAISSIHNIVEAVLDRATVTAGGAVRLIATDNAHITTDAGGASVFLHTQRSSGGLLISLGAGVALNEIGDTVTAHTDRSAVRATGDVAATATAGGSIHVLALGIGGGLSGGSTPGGFSLIGAGSAASNAVNNTVQALISGGTTSARHLDLGATDAADINADAGAVSLLFARGPPTAGFALGVSISINDIHAGVRSSIEGGASVTTTAGAALTAGSTATIDSLTLAGGATLNGDGHGLMVTGAGAISFNRIGNTVESRIPAGNSVNGGTGAIVLTASDAPTIDADAGGIAIGVNLGSSGGAQITIGAGVAINQISDIVHAALNAPVVAPGGISLTATTSVAHIDSFAFGLAGAVSLGSFGGFSLAGAGAAVANTVTNTVESLVSNVNLAGAGPLTLTATDDARIKGVAGGLAVSVGGQVSIGVGASFAINTVSNTVHSIVESSTLGTTAAPVGAVSLGAAERTVTDAKVLVGAASVGTGGPRLGGVSLGGAAGAAVNTVTNTVEALLRSGTTVVTGPAADVTLSADDFSRADADAAAGALAFFAAHGSPAAVAGAGALAGNNIAHTVRASVDHATVHVGHDLSVSASSSANDHTIAVGLSLALSGGSAGGISLDGAGSGTGNTIANTVEASIKASTIDPGGAVTVRASDASTIISDAGAAAISLAGGNGGGVAGAVGVSVASNRIGNTPIGGVLRDHRIRALIEGSAIGTPADKAHAVTVTATSTATIDALAVAGAAAGSTGAGGVAFGGAGAGAGNTTKAIVEALVRDGTSIATASGGDVTLDASNSAKMRVKAGSLALAAAVNHGAGISLAGAGAFGDNEISDITRAAIDSATVSSGGSVSVTARSNEETTGLNQEIDATVIGLAGALAGGEGGGVSFTGAGSVALNTITTSVQADITASTVSSGSERRVLVAANDSSHIHALAGAGALAAGGGFGAGFSVAIGLSIAVNDIGTSVRGVITRSTVTSDDRLFLFASSTGNVDSSALGGTLSLAGTGGVAASVALGGAKTRNTMHGTTEAMVQEPDRAAGRRVTASGEIFISAGNNASIDTLTVGASFALSGSIVGALSVAAGGALADNRITYVVRAGVEAASVESTGGSLSIEATSLSQIKAKAIAIAASLSASTISFSIGAAGALSSNDTGLTVEAFIRNGAVVRAALGRVRVQARDSSGIDATVVAFTLSGSFDPNFATGVSDADSTVDNTVSASVAGSAVTAGSAGILIEADADQAVTTSSVAISLAASVFGGSTAGANASATVLGTTQASASAATLTATGGPVQVLASSHLSTDASAKGGSFGTAIALSAMQPLATVAGVTTAFVSGAVTVTASSLEITATGTHGATAGSFNLSVGFVAHAGTKADATVTRTTQAALAAGSTVDTTGIVTVLSDAVNRAEAATPDRSGGVIAIESTEPTAEIGAATRARADGQVIHAAALTVTSLADNFAKATATVGNLSVVGGSGAHAVAVVTAAAATEALVGSNAVIAIPGAVTVTAGPHVTEDSADPQTCGKPADPHTCGNTARAKAELFSGAILAVSLIGSTATVSGATRALVDGRVTQAGSVTLAADQHNQADAKMLVTKIGAVNIDLDGSAGALAEVTSGAVAEARVGASGVIGITGAVQIRATSHSDATAFSQGRSFGLIVVGVRNPAATVSGRTIAAFDGHVTGASALTVEATGTSNAKAAAGVVAVGIVGVVSSSPEAHAADSVTASVGPDAGIATPAAAVVVRATGTSNATANVDGPSFGVVTVSAGDPTASNSSHVHAELLGNVSVVSGGTTAPGAQSVTLLARGIATAAATLDNSSAGAVNVDAGATANANANPVVDTKLGVDGSVVMVAGDISAKALGTTDADSSASSGQNGVLTLRSFSSNATSEGTVTTTVAGGALLDAGGLIEIGAAHNRAPGGGDGTFNGGPIDPGNPGAGGVDPSDGPVGNSITFAVPHGLQTGDVVTYDARGPQPVGGLANGRQYGVIVPAGNQVTVQLGAGFDDVVVDLDTDTITFPQPHNLVTGDDIFYFAQTTAIGGLVSGRRYKVTRVDDLTIKLFDPATPATTVTVPGSSIGANTVTTGPGNPFANGDPVSYQAPGPTGSFTSPLVDAQVDSELRLVFVNHEIVTEDNDTIYIAVDRDGDGQLEDHGILTGQALVYQVDGSGPAIGGLVPGTAYFAIRVDARRIRLSATPNGPAIPLNPDKTAAGRSVVHTLQRDADKPLPNLVDARVYFVVNRTAATFQLAEAPGGTPLSLNPDALTGGPHRFTRDGLDLTSAGAGDQKLVIDITGTSSGTHRLAGGGVGFVGADPSDRTTKASAAGRGKALLQIGRVTARAIARATVEAVIESGATLRAGRITVTTDAVVNSQGVSSNGGGAAVAIGGSTTVGTASTDSHVTIARDAHLTATGDIAIGSTSELNGSSSASPSKLGLFGSGATANATTNLDYATQTTVDGTVTAGTTLRVTAVTILNGVADGRAKASGLVADADGTGTLHIGLSRGDTKVELLEHAVLTAPDVTIDSAVEPLHATAIARAKSTSGGALQDANANIVVHGATLVVLNTGASVTGTAHTILQARYAAVDVHPDAFGECSCFLGDTDANANAFYQTLAQVTGLVGATVTTADLTVAATQVIARFRRDAHTDGAVIGPEDSRVGGVFDAQRQVFWESRVVLLGSAPNPELEVDRTGRIIRLVNVAVRDESGVAYGLGDTIAGNIIFVQPITNAGNGHARLLTNDPGDSTSHGDDSNHNLRRPDSKILGNAAVFQIKDTFDFVHITNFSPKTLVTGLINVLNTSGRADIVITADNIPGPVDVPAFPSPVQPTDPETFELDIAHVFVPTQIEIRNLMPVPGVANSDIVIGGSIDNPIGRTLIENDRGNIVAFSDPEFGAVIRTNILEMDADIGSIGLPADASLEQPRSPITAVLVQYRDAAGVRHDTDLLVEAGVDVVFDLTGSRRDVVPAGEPFVVRSGSIRAGNDVDILVKDSNQGTDLGQAGLVTVNLFHPNPAPPDEGPLLCPSPPGCSGPYRNHFRPDEGRASDSVVRAFGFASTLVASEWRFADVRAGRNIDMRHTSPLTFLSLTMNTDADATLNDLDTGASVSVSDGIGKIDLLARGSIIAVEEPTKGDLRVGRIRSALGDVTLGSGRMIVDADHDAGLGVERDVTGGNITMTAGTDGGQGGIGAAADYLEIDVDAVAGRLGVLTAVDTAATSTAGVFLDELGDLPVNIVDTDGDVSLVASGSIVDGRNGGLGDTATGIAGNSIDLVADDGSIGAAGGGNDVEIDSSRGAVGDVGLVAPGSILVTETAGVLNLVIASAGGNIRLTVRDNVSRLDDDLVLLRTGSVRLGEGTILAVPNGRIAAPFGSVTLRVGDDITTDRTSEILAGAQIDIFGDDTDTDPSVGSTVVLRGTITPGPGFLIRVLGNADPDTILFDQTVLAGKTRAFGGNGEDTFTVFHLPTMNVGAGDTLTLDGQAQGDRYTVQTTGSQGDRRTYVINVLDTGAPDDGADTLSIFGNDAPASSDTAPADDIFLLRRATSIPGESADRPAYVALLHGALALHRDLDPANAPTEVQRVNYDAALNGRLSVFGLGGNDYFAVDDNSAVTTLDGGNGVDQFQIGQLYGLRRDTVEGHLPPQDVFPELAATTRGWLSPGITAPLLVHGDSGKDTATVYANHAELRLEGDEADDQVEVRAFALAAVVDTDANGDGRLDANDIDHPTIDRNGDGVVNAADAHTTETYLDDVIALVNGAARPILGTGFVAGRPSDVRIGGNETRVRYNINAPVSVDGGNGSDKLVVVLTEFADDTVINEQGFVGAGLNVRHVAVETFDADAMEGDDELSVVGTPFGVSTKVIGGTGTDKIDLSGDVSSDIVVRELEGASGAVNHLVRSPGDPAYDRLVVPGVDLNVAGSPAGAPAGLVIVAESGGLTAVREGSTVDTYTVRLARAPLGTVYVTVSAAAALLQEEQPGGGPAGDTVLVSTGGGPARRSIVLVFTPANWNLPQTVTVSAVDDQLSEGDRVVAISHSTISADPAFDHLAVRNVEALVRDNDRPGVVVIEVEPGTSTEDARTSVLEGDTASAINHELTVELTKAPAAGKIVVVQLVLSDSEIVLSSTDSRFNATAKTITFTPANWNVPVRMVVKAKLDTTAEDPRTTLVTFKRGFGTTDSGFVFADRVLDVEVLDDDKPGAVVVPSNGSTLVTPGLTDTYTLRLTKRPAATVTIVLATDGQTDVTSINGVPVTLQPIGELVPVTLFTGTVSFSGKTITRSSGSFVSDGFAAGQLLRIVGSPNAGDYTIASVTSTKITLTTTLPASGSYSVKLQRLDRNGIFTGQVSFDAARNRLTRTDGGSWLADGFLEGQRIRIDGAGDFKIALIRGTNATKDNTLELTAENLLPALPTGVHTVTRIAAVATFTTANWFQAQTIEVAADPNFVPQPNRKDVKNFAIQPRTPSSRQHGPITVVDDTTGADRSLKTAVKLPGEADTALRPIGRLPSTSVVSTGSAAAAAASLDPVTAAGLEASAATPTRSTPAGDPSSDVPLAIEPDSPRRTSSAPSWLHRTATRD